MNLQVLDLHGFWDFILVSFYCFVLFLLDFLNSVGVGLREIFNCLVGF